MTSSTSSARLATRAGSVLTGRTLVLPERVLERLVRHAQDCLPEECCGVLIGSTERPDRWCVGRAVEAENVSDGDRLREYQVAPEAVLEAVHAARADGLEIVGYYHSHPSGSVKPSPSDERSAWPDTSYVILGMDGTVLRDVKSWRLNPEKAGFVEEALIEGREP